MVTAWCTIGDGARAVVRAGSHLHIRTSRIFTHYGNQETRSPFQRPFRTPRSHKEGALQTIGCVRPGNDLHDRERRCDRCRSCRGMRRQFSGHEPTGRGHACQRDCPATQGCTLWRQANIVPRPTCAGDGVVPEIISWRLFAFEYSLASAPPDHSSPTGVPHVTNGRPPVPLASVLHDTIHTRAITPASFGTVDMAGWSDVQLQYLRAVS